MLSYHPDGLTVDIVGIIASNIGRNCEDHPFCGEIVKLAIAVCFFLEMIHGTGAGGTNGGPGREEQETGHRCALGDQQDQCLSHWLPPLAHEPPCCLLQWCLWSDNQRQRNMGFCPAAVISPLNGDTMVVEVAGGGVAAVGEMPAGMAPAEAVKKFCLGGP